MKGKRINIKYIIPALLFVLVFNQILSAQNSLRYPDDIICGAERTEAYVDLIKGKRVGLVGNQSSLIGNTHLLDSLLALGIEVKKIYSPEHGFRGQAENGEKVTDQVDQKTGIPVISLYGKKLNDNPTDLEGIDILMFDIQDVGVRFYTYISTLNFVMEALAKESMELIVLDRPNPNGFYVDGPIRNESLKSFVSLHPIPIVHGMTIGEYARMINGEGWLEGGIKCKLHIVECENYDHLCTYDLPIKPSPNLPNFNSVILYSSLCYFEGSNISLGRGTDFPFQVYGHPEMKTDFTFSPRSIPGASLHPKHEGKTCQGFDLRECGPERVLKERKIILDWVISAFKEMDSDPGIFTAYFDKLMGTTWVRQDIINGLSADEIRVKWSDDVQSFKKIRKKYLLYPDFE